MTNDPLSKIAKSKNPPFLTLTPEISRFRIAVLSVRSRANADVRG
jgi:hypothetical protein